MKLVDLVRIKPRAVKDEIKQEKRKNRPEVAVMPLSKGDGEGDMSKQDSEAV